MLFSKLHKKQYSTVAFYILALGLMLVEVSNQSFNADEAVRLYYITAESFAKTMQYSLQQKQPLFMLAAWCWESLAGSGEWAMRAMNIPFALAAVWYVRRILTGLGRNTWYALLLVIQPIFAWYMNEVDPSLMLGAAAAAFFYYSLYAPQPEKPANLVKAHLAFVLGSFTSYAFVFIYPVFLAAAAKRARCREDGGKKQKKKIYAAAGLYVLCVWGLMALGAAPVPGAGMDRLGIMHFAAMIYLFMGLGGLSLSRNELRAQDWAALDLFGLLAAAVLLLAIVLVAVALYRRKRFFRMLAPHGTLLAGCGGYLALFWVTSLVFRFPFTERNVFPMVVLLALLETELLDILQLSRAHRALQGAIIVLIALQLISCGRLRFADRYGKEDYRSVSRYLREAQQDSEVTILASGYHLAYRFYGVAFDHDCGFEIGETDVVTTPVDGYAVVQLQTAVDEAEKPVILVLNQNELPLESYKWEGTEASIEIGDANGFRIFWIE